jgi:hypothetical protein
MFHSFHDDSSIRFLTESLIAMSDNAEMTYDDVITMASMFEAGEGKLYHATYQACHDSIMKHGLEPAKSKKVWDFSKDDVVYLATTPEMAISFAETAENVPEAWIDEIIVFEVDFLDVCDNLQPDDSIREEPFCTCEHRGGIPADKLKLYDPKQPSATPPALGPSV